MDAKSKKIIEAEPWQSWNTLNLDKPNNEDEFVEFVNLYPTEILLEFVSKLITNSQDLEGEIAEMVNEHFWDLI